MKILFLYELGGHDEARALRETGHNVDFVSTAQWAYEKIVENEKLNGERYAAAIIHGSDDMPVDDGQMLSTFIQQQSPETLRIVYTGEITSHYRDQFMKRFDAIASKLRGIRGLEALLKTIEK